MARPKNNGNGHLDKAMVEMAQAQRELDKAMRELSQSQATMVNTQASLLAEIAETNRVAGDRFSRVERILVEHSRILQEHSVILQEYRRMLENMPDAVRDKFGFQSPGKAN